MVRMFTLICLAISFNSGFCLAEQKVEDISKKSYLKSFSYFTGFAKGELSQKDSYKIVPSIFRFSFDMDKMGIGAADIVSFIADKGFNKTDLSVKGETEFLAEPFINTIISPDSNLEVGFDLLVKYSYPVTNRISPYFFTGGGVIFMTQHTNEQSTQFNFIPQLGGGISYDLTENRTISLEYRYRHLSNADTKAPNDGINVNMFLIGVTHEY